MTDHVSGGAGAAGAASGGQSAGAQDQGQQGQVDMTQEQIYALSESLQQQAGQNQALQSTIDRMRSALMGDEGKPENDGEPDLSWYDDVLKVAFEAEKAGRGMPVTVDLATRVKAQVQENAQLRKTVQQLEQKVKTIANPEVLHNQRVYENIDNHIRGTIEQLYGEIDPQFEMFVSSKLAQTIKEVQKSQPEAWQKIRSSDAMQKKMVAEVVKSAVPKSVREKLRDDYLQNSEMTREELAEAYAQAEHIEDQNVRAKVKAEARQRYFETLFTEKKGNSFQGMVNRHR
jgi:hypothetical protein